MSLKHFRQYKNDIEKLYKSLQDEIVTYQEDFANCYVDEDRYKSLVASTNNIGRDYRMIEYIDYLLNMPNKEKKVPKYERQNQKKLDTFTAHNMTKEQRIKEDTREVENFKGGLETMISQEKEKERAKQNGGV